jgi:hypothetical protein
MTKRRKHAKNLNINLNGANFTRICSANSKRNCIYISNGQTAGKNAWLFFGNIGNAIIGEGYFLKAAGDPYKSEGEGVYKGPICGIATDGNTEIGVVEY